MAAVLVEGMADRGRGRIALVGTAAAAHSLSFAAAYSGSKAGLARYADALRLAAGEFGVSVTLVSPGFFADKPSRERAASRPGEISAVRVADKMIAAVAARRAELVVPCRFLLLRWLDRLMPRTLRNKVLLSLRLP